MWQQHFQSIAGSSMLALPLLALVIFIAVFAAVVLRLYLAGDGTRRFDDVAHLPLDGTKGDDHG